MHEVNQHIINRHTTRKHCAHTPKIDYNLDGPRLNKQTNKHGTNRKIVQCRVFFVVVVVAVFILHTNTLYALQMIIISKNIVYLLSVNLLISSNRTFQFKYLLSLVQRTVNVEPITFHVRFQCIGQFGLRYSLCSFTFTAYKLCMWKMSWVCDNANAFICCCLGILQWNVFFPFVVSNGLNRFFFWPQNTSFKMGLDCL